MSAEKESDGGLWNTQSLRAKLEELGYKPGNGDMSLPEQGMDLAKSITSTSGVVGLMAAAMLVAQVMFIYMLLTDTGKGLSTVATHQTAMLRRIDELTLQVRDLERAQLQGARPTWNPYDNRGYTNREERNATQR